ncbi:hypothetical protein ALT1644_50033 [Alteromonas macleodii]
MFISNLILPFNHNTNLCILNREYVNNRTWALHPHIKDITNEPSSISWRLGKPLVAEIACSAS